MRKLWRRIYVFLNRNRLEQELADEMSAHREMMPAADRAEFGDTMRLHEASRDVWAWRWIEDLRMDLLFGVRVLLRAPGFTLGAAAVLALGVGVNLAEYQIFDALFHRLKVRDADAVLQFSRATKEGSRADFTHTAVEHYRSQSTVFAWMASEAPSSEVVAEGEAQVRSSLVSSNYFGSLAVTAAWGRLPDARDVEPSAPAVAALGYDYWRTRWASDPNAIGRMIHINGTPVRIIGVTPYDFDGLMPRRTAIWRPVRADSGGPGEMLFGKLKAGVAPPAAEAELNSLRRRLQRLAPPGSPDDGRITARPVQPPWYTSKQVAPAVAIFFIMILLVLLSACANLGNMVLARGLSRQREISIRLSIGASRARVFRQLMTENLLLAVLGSAAGLTFGALAARITLRTLDAPPDIQISTGWSLMIVGFLSTFLSATAFGLPSALQAVRSTCRKAPLRKGLIGTQACVSCLLLIASAVLAHQGMASASIDVAFDYKNMVIVDPQLYSRKLPVAAIFPKIEALATRMTDLPGVDGVTVATAAPFGGRMISETLPGLPRILRNPVAASYFGVMKLPLVRGRVFLPEEKRVIVINETAARVFWPHQDPLGRAWKTAGAERTVVGVVKDSGANLLTDPDSVETYVPIESGDAEQSELILHTRGDPAPLLRMIASTAASGHEAVSVSLMRAGRESRLEGQRKMVILIGAIAAVATVLAAAGMFALVAFAVAQRKRELGIRIAVGARPVNILTILATQNAWAIAAGIAAGTILAVGLFRLVRGMVVLQHSQTVDMAGFALGVGVFGIAAVAATLAPAIRALRIDPSVTLREE